MMRIAIVEDEKKDCDRLKRYLDRYQQEKQMEINFEYFLDGLTFVEDYRPVFDIVLMDIAMPHMNGMEAARSLRKVDKGVCLIFITNMSQYAVEGYAVDALDFLLKPLVYSRFAAVMDKAVRNRTLKKKQMMMFQTTEGCVCLDAFDICYFQSEKHYIDIVTVKQQYRIRSSMKELEQKLDGRVFFRCDNSYIVNLARIDKIVKDTVIMNGFQIPISRPRRKDFLDAFTCYMGEV